MSRQPTPSDHYQLVIVGAGPAGMAAAIQASQLGLHVAVFDMQRAPGGQIYRNLQHNAAYRPQLERVMDSAYFAGQSLLEAFASATIEYFPEAKVWQARPDGAVGLTLNGLAYLVKADVVLLANGAMERPTPFEGWTLPGVMGAGAAQTLLKSSHLYPSGPTAIVGTGPLAILVAYQLMNIGVDIRGLLLTSRLTPGFNHIVPLVKAMPRVTDLLKGLKWLGAIKRRRIPIFTGVSDLRAEGKDAVDVVHFRAGNHAHKLAVDTLLTHDGVIPGIDIIADTGCQLAWNKEGSYWAPGTNGWGRTNLETVYVAGDAQGIGGAKAAEVRGTLAALSIADQLGQISKSKRDDLASPLWRELRSSLSMRSFLDAQFPVALSAAQPSADTVLCRCEEVRVKDLSAELSHGVKSIDQIKSITRCGMGPCQGRMCGSSVARLVARESRLGVDAVGSYRGRFPVRPISLNALAELSVASHLDVNRMKEHEADKPPLQEES